MRLPPICHDEMQIGHRFGKARHFDSWSRGVSPTGPVQVGAGSPADDRTNPTPTSPGKRTARLHTTLTKRVIDALQPTDKKAVTGEHLLNHPE